MADVLISPEVINRCPCPGSRPLEADRDDSALLADRTDDIANFASLFAWKNVVELSAASGDGKTSFLGLGLTESSLAKHAGGRWKIGRFTAWADLPYRLGPDARLAAAIERSFGLAGPPVDETAAAAWIQEQDAGDVQRLLVFDQLEELLRSAPEQGRELLESVAWLARATRFKVVLSLRADVRGELVALEHNLDPSYWFHYVLQAVHERAIDHIVRVPFGLSGATVDEDVVSAVRQVWSLAVRDATEPAPELRMRGDRLIGLLHVQALTFVLWCHLEATHALAGGHVDVSSVQSLADRGSRAMALFAGFVGAGRIDQTSAARALLEHAIREQIGLRLRSTSMGSKVDPTVAEETLDIVAAASPHLSSATFKVVHDTDTLARLALPSLVDLGALHVAGSDGATRPIDAIGHRPLSMAHAPADDADVVALALGEARHLKDGELMDGDALAHKVEQRLQDTGVDTDQDPENPGMVGGRLKRRGMSAVGVACELVVSYERALRWLAKSHLVRLSATSALADDDSDGRTVAIVHDGIGSAIEAWGFARLHDPSVDVRRPFAEWGTQVLAGPGRAPLMINSEDKSEFSIIRHAAWPGCAISADFLNVVFEDCNLTGASFGGCTFTNVTFQNCQLWATLFDSCTFIDCRIQGPPESHLTFKDAAIRALGFRKCRIRDFLTFERLQGTSLTFDDLAGPGGLVFAACDVKHVAIGAAGLGDGAVRGGTLHHLQLSGAAAYRFAVEGGATLRMVDSSGSASVYVGGIPIVLPAIEVQSDS